MSVTDQDAIAIIGAGVAGLSAARLLTRAGASVHVFDKGRSVGGRVSTRRDESAQQFDHGAQYFTAASAEFAAQVSEWVAEGVAAEWRGRLAAIECGNDGWRLATTPQEKKRYVGVPGMDAIAKRLAEEVAGAGGRVTTGTRVAPLKRGDGRWRLASESGEPLGDFAKVLVTAPAPQAAELLTPSPALSNAAKSVRMTGCWAVMVAFDRPAEAAFDGAFVNGSPEATPLSWIARNSSKPGRPEGDAWVLHSSPEWTELNFDVPLGVAVHELEQAFWRAVGVTRQPPGPAPKALLGHRWRFALPTNPLADRVIADRSLGLYAAGDWCGGPKVEGAYLSGLAAGEAILIG
jgi:predicted NAD/FAD-dependent oxidoreductase